MFVFSERRVLLRRGPTGFGFNIIGDDNDQGVFISLIQPGSPADQSGALHSGDRILSVNNIDLRGVSHENAASVLKNCGETANLVVVNRYDGILKTL